MSRESHRRAWRRAQRSIFRLPFGPVLAATDLNRLREIQKRHAGEKYADVDHWLRVNRERVQDLKLHRRRSQRVLDLGCGGGYFLFILKRLNHSVLGLDVDREPLFRELLDVFDVPRVTFEIKPFEPLPDLDPWPIMSWLRLRNHFRLHREEIIDELRRRLPPGQCILWGAPVINANAPATLDNRVN